MSQLDLIQQQELIDRLAQGRAGKNLSREDLGALADVGFVAHPDYGVNEQMKDEGQVREKLHLGPDGLMYMTLDLPIQTNLGSHPEEADFNLVSLRELANQDFFCRSCVGVVIRSKVANEASVLPFTPGNIWALREFGHTNPTQSAIANVEYFRSGTNRAVFLAPLKAEFIIGEPSSELIPNNIRTDLADNLTRVLGIKDPKFCILKSMEPGATPTLVYSYFPDEPVSKSPGYEVLRRLHPPLFDLTIANSGCSGLEKYMVRVRPD